MILYIFVFDWKKTEQGSNLQWQHIALVLTLLKPIAWLLQRNINWLRSRCLDCTVDRELGMERIYKK